MENKTTIKAPESVNNAFNELLNKMYISNVRNRLRQLNEPTENDCKRWIWELIQNAKDSISHCQNRHHVDVKIIVKENEVIFKHNGSPFTAKAQLGLLYKYSEGKVNNSESTGRFGTGFLTTHTLSKIVTIEGDVYSNDIDNNELCGFSATMYRDGLDEPELLEGVNKMRESMVYTKELNEWTTYTYHLTTPQNKNALKLGLKDFIQNIAQVMLFCKELNTVELYNNNEVTSINRKQTKELTGDIFLSKFEIKSGNNQTRFFIHKYIEKHSDELTKRFKTDRKVRLMAAIEIDKENNLVENETAPSHFCVLPLVGSEKHTMPIYLNSPDFEPDSERESLILVGEDLLVDKGVISEGGINRLILKESVELFDSLVSFISDNEYKKLFLLAKGLKKTPDFEKNFNKDWFENEIILKYRAVLKKYAVVETENGNQKLFNDDGAPNIIIPTGNKEVRQKIYSLATELFPTKLPLEKYAANWASLAWNDCGLFEKEDLCKVVSEKGNASNLPNYDWLNKFLTFIKDEDETFLKKYALIPNVNGDLISLEDENFAEGIELTEYMLDVLNKLGKDLTPTLLNINITAITLPIKIDKKSIAEKINDQTEIIISDSELSVVETIENLLPLLNTIPTNENEYNVEFIQKQKQIHHFTKTLYSQLEIIENTNNDIPEKAFQALHKWLITQLINTVSNYKNIASLPDTIENKIDWLNSFISFVSKEIKEGELDEYAIIPNQKGNFCYKKDLSKDINIPEELKTERAEIFGIKLRDILLNKDINSINISSEKNINTIIETINEIFKINKFENEDDDLEFAVYLVHFIPEQTSPTLWKSQNSFLSIIRKYYYERSKSYSEQTINCNSEDFWRKANDKIVSSLKSHLEEDKNIKGLQDFLSDSGRPYDNGDTIIFLNDFYDYLKHTNRNISGKIIPNQNGDFCSLDDLFNDDNISKELKDVLFLVNSDKDFRNILAETSLSIQPVHSKTIEDIAKPIDESIKETFADSRNWEDENFKRAIALLIEYFKKHRENSKNYFSYSYGKRDSIELNVLLSEKDREIIQSYLKGELGVEHVKQKDLEIAQLKEENSKLKIKNKELERLLAEKEEIENEKIKLEQRLKEIVKTDPNSSEIEIIQDKIRVKDDEIAAIGDTTIAIDYDSDISVSDQKEANREAKEVVKERLEKEGFSFTRGIDGYSTIDGVIKGDTEYPLVVKSYKFQGAPLKIGTNEWIQLMKPNSMFWVHFGDGKLGCLKLYELLRGQDKLSLSFSTENLDKENRLQNFAEILHYFKNVHFDFNSIKPSDYSVAKDLHDYRFDERSTETDLSADDDTLL